jgi:hypothetical protein
LLNRLSDDNMIKRCSKKAYLLFRDRLITWPKYWMMKERINDSSI